jgi:hypothetical protein
MLISSVFQAGSFQLRPKFFIFFFQNLPLQNVKPSSLNSMIKDYWRKDDVIGGGVSEGVFRSV